MYKEVKVDPNRLRTPYRDVTMPVGIYFVAKGEYTSPLHEWQVIGAGAIHVYLVPQLKDHPNGVTLECEAAVKDFIACDSFSGACFKRIKFTLAAAKALAAKHERAAAVIAKQLARQRRAARARAKRA